MVKALGKAPALNVILSFDTLEFSKLIPSVLLPDRFSKV